MADLILNEALGRSLVEIQNVDDGGADRINVRAWVISAADNDLRDAADRQVTTFDAIVGVAEASPYTIQQMDGTDITILVDDTNDQTDVTFVDQTFTSVAVQTAWTDITLDYNASGTPGVTDLIFDVFDFAVTPNTGDITVDFPAVSHRYKQA